MTMSARSRYAGHRFPPEVISHAIRRKRSAEALYGAA